MPTDYTTSLEEAHHPKHFSGRAVPHGRLFYSFGPDQSKADATEVTLRAPSGARSRAPGTPDARKKNLVFVFIYLN